MSSGFWAYNIRALDALARQVAAADLVNEDKLNLLQTIKRLVADTANEMTKLEHRGALATELVPHVRALLHRLQETGVTCNSILSRDAGRLPFLSCDRSWPLGRYPETN